MQKLFRKLSIALTLAISIVGFGIQSALAEDLVFSLKNSSSHKLVGFYIEPTELDDWGENILQGSLKSGETGTVTIVEGKTTCMYAIRGVFEDGSAIEEETLNLCKLGSYTYHD